MSDEIYRERPISLRDAAKMLPRRKGKRVHPSTIYRWMTNGVRGIRLESRKIGGQRCTSRGALTRFSKQLSRLDYSEESKRPHVSERSRKQAERGNSLAEKKLRD